LLQETKKKNVSLPPYLEKNLFRRGVSKKDRLKLWGLVRDDFSMNKESKVEFLLSLSEMKRWHLKHWIKELIWREDSLKRAIFNLLVEEDVESVALEKYKAIFMKKKQIGKDAKSIVQLLKLHKGLVGFSY